MEKVKTIDELPQETLEALQKEKDELLKADGKILAKDKDFKRISKEIVRILMDLQKLEEEYMPIVTKLQRTLAGKRLELEVVQIKALKIKPKKLKVN